MNITKFEKVSFEQFKKDFADTFNIDLNGDEAEENLEYIKNVYDEIKLPKRATTGSAGYDFYAPIDFYLKPNQTIKIPTGIRAFMKNEQVLMLFPRSGLGFKYRLQLNNTIGVVDRDYVYSDNEGHIFAKITNDTNEDKTISINVGEGFIQGIFLQYGVTEDDNTNGIRNGGFGSTTGTK